MSSVAASQTVADLVAHHNWTICRSVHHRDTPPEPWKTQEQDAAQQRTPPSLWDDDTFQKHCFLHRNDGASAPGSALFQHWLADFGKEGGGGPTTTTTTRSSSKTKNSKSEANARNNNNFDPWKDFPTWEILRQYPDIGEEDDAARDYYTLWYTTEVEIPKSSSSGAEDDTIHVTLEDADNRKGNDNPIGEEGTQPRSWRRGHLTLHGVNYQPMVYFDGKLLQPYSTTTSSNHEDNTSAQENAGGMFLRRHYDLGIWSAGGIRSDDPPSSTILPLEILVLPPPVVGRPVRLNSTDDVNPKYGLERGQGGDHNLAQSGAVMQFAAGWDWTQSTPDRNVGIWDRVELEWIEGDVRLHDLHVKVLNISVEGETEKSADEDEWSTLPLGDDVLVTARLDVSVTATYHQSGDGGPIEGYFEYWIVPLTSIGGEGTVSGTIHNIRIDRSVKECHMGNVILPNAKVWWPHTHSTRRQQPMYSVQVTFRSYGNHDENAPLHQAQAQTNMGIRTMSSFTHPQTKSFALAVNGHPIFLVGGNWITTDQFLRYSNSPERYLQELSMLRHSGINAIRVWGGGVAETQHFYDAADALGLLVYQEFWMTGDNNGRFAGSYDWPNDHDAYLANARDTIKRLRNHPSLCWYGGGNELSPIPPLIPSDSKDGREKSAVSPPKDVEEVLKQYVAELDGRPYMTSSVTDAGDEFDNTRTLAPKDGPYGILSEELFFDRNPGLTSPLLSEDEVKQKMKPSDVRNKNSPGRNIGFQTEVGSVSQPDIKSLKRFLSEDALNSYPDCGESSEYGGTIQEEWVYFKYLPFTESNGLDRICQFKFPPNEDDELSKHRMDSIEDYSWAAQFAQYLQYKSLFEGYTYRMWEWYTAVFLWKASSPSPTFRGALYDWYLATNGGYWGTRAGLAGGSPVRLVLNLRDWTVHVINVEPKTFLATSVEWSAYSLKGVLLANDEIEIPSGQIYGNSVVHLEGSLPWVAKSKLFTANSYGLQDIILYRLGLSYADELGATSNAKNIYYLTDPLARGGGHAQSRFSLLGAMRKEVPRVSLDVNCQISANNFECTLENAQRSSNGEVGACDEISF